MVILFGGFSCLCNGGCTAVDKTISQEEGPRVDIKHHQWISNFCILFFMLCLLVYGFVLLYYAQPMNIQILYLYFCICIFVFCFYVFLLVCLQPSPRCPDNDKVLPRDCNKLGRMINADGGAKQHTDIGHKGHTIDILMQCFYRAVMKKCKNPSFVMDAWRQKLCRTNRERIDWRDICLHDLFSTQYALVIFPGRD